MNALVLFFIGITMMAGGYLLYSKFLGKKIYALSATYETPAHSMQDGVDYVPTNKFVLWGHHFTSVAGAAPIVGPAIAVIWGWLPAFLWVTIGTVFIAGMHDLGTLWASQRHKGQSMGTLSGRYIGAKGRNLFLIVTFLLLLMVVSAFAVVISDLLVTTPSAVIPTWGAIIVALGIGQAVYKLRWNLIAVSIVGVVLLYSLMILGDAYPIAVPEDFLGIGARGFWILVLFIYGAIASLLPVWVLLQPRDYINGLQLFVGLGILYLAFLITSPEVVAPALNNELPSDTPSMVPLLFVTIACGAISGFHGIVAAGTSSKQLDKETDARFVGYLGAVGEGLLALGAIIATTAGFRSLRDWQEIYQAFGDGGVQAFVTGGGSLLNEGLGISPSLSATILATMAVLFAATTMDTGIRLQRMVVQEIGEMFNIRLSPTVSTFIVVGVALGLTFSAGSDGSGGMLIWPLFGTTNQLMAALSLIVISVILARLRRPTWPVVVPLTFVLVVSFWGLLVQMMQFFQSGNWLLFSLDVLILIAASWVIVVGASALSKAKQEPQLHFGDRDEDVLVKEAN